MTPVGALGRPKARAIAEETDKMSATVLNSMDEDDDDKLSANYKLDRLIIGRQQG